MAVASIACTQSEEAWTVPIACPAVFDLQDWVELPAIVDGIVSPDTRLAFESSLRAKAIAQKYPEWLDPYEATLVCAAGVLRHTPCGQHLLETVMRLDLSPERRARAERIAADHRVRHGGARQDGEAE
uniref:Putative cytidylyltransferase n=1 Tax=uncultured bacterium 1062 TaxID=548898 RepID=B8R8X0_9BACT|nr:putative cytidylyltransferase [uncultured bacterium 1062]